MRTLPLLILLLTALPAAARPPSRSCELRAVTLKPGERLRHPWLRVPVGPDRPLSVRGREAPISFEEAGERLRVLDGSEPAPVVGDGESVAVRLEGETARSFVFLRGDEEAGEPRWSVVSLEALAGRIGNERLLFLDHDADGTYLTPFTDFLVRAKGEDLHPVAPVVVLGRGVYRLEPEEAGRAVRWTPDEQFADRDVFPSWAGVAEGLAHLNRVRGAMNLLPVALDREASADTMLHVRYLGQNGGNGHLEEEGRPGYTRKGLAAGLNSIGSLNQGGVVSSIDGHLSSLLHRMDLIDPTITRIGIACDSSRVWIHTECGEHREWSGQGPVIFPGPRHMWHLGTYSGENPDPRPEGEGKTSGLPITVAWYGEHDIRKVGLDLRGPRGRVAGWKNDSGRRDLKTIHSEIRAVIIPNTSLGSAKHVLTVTWLEGEVPRRLDYAFRIGRWK